jgi:hypothetical protein
MHITLLVLLPTFAWLMWWQLIHDDPTVFTRRQGPRRGPDGEELGPEEEPGWALSGGRQSRHRDTPAATAAATAGATTMVGSPADQPRSGSAADRQLTEVEVDTAVEDAEEEDPELAEYNRYLAELNAGPDRKRW